MRVRKEAALAAKLMELARDIERDMMDDDEQDDDQNSHDEEAPEVLVQTDANSDDAGIARMGTGQSGHRRRTADYRRRSSPANYPPSYYTYDLPVMRGDENPIGLGTIPGSHGLLVMTFTTDGKLSKSALETIELNRRFPAGYYFGGYLEPRPNPPETRKTQITKGDVNQFINFKLKNVNFIICPFMSTLVNMGALPLKQTYKRQELSDATTLAGLDPSVTEEHVADNFENDLDGIFDLWNLEGETDEHQSSTGINDCSTSATYCQGSPGRRSCQTSTARNTCTLPNSGLFNQFVLAVDTNHDGYITVQELNDAGDRAGLDGINAQTTILDDTDR